jgi:single-strand DNA-binding protein
MAIMNMGIAFNDRRKNAQTGEWEDVGNFADAVLFGTRAESLANFLHKGSRVAIDGKLRWSQWEREGQKRSKLEIMVDDLVMLDPRQNGQGGSQGGYQQQAGGYAYGGGNAPQAAPQRPQGGYQQAPQQQYQQQAQPMPQQAPASSVYEQTDDIYSEDLPF